MFETGANNHYQNNLNLCCQNDAYLYNAIKAGNSAKVEAELVRIQKQTDAQYNDLTGFDPSEYLGTPETRAEALEYCKQYWEEGDTLDCSGPCSGDCPCPEGIKVR